jgi:D-alanine-D-alanine ligase
VTDRSDLAVPLPPKVRLVVLFGGQSAEHEVSCITAAHVVRAADPTRYDVVPIGITRDGTWLQNDDALSALEAGAARLPARLEASGTEVDPLPTVRAGATQLPVVVLPLLHGPHGEDGTVQGLLEVANVPFVGSGVLGSAVCMDKAMAKTVAQAAGIPQCNAFTLNAAQGTAAQLAAKAETVMSLGSIDFPVFVKPANLGSSVGITKAHDAGELAAAIETALAYDDRLVVEETVVGREIEVAVLGNSVAGRPPRASVPGEIVPGHEFYDYDDKYLDETAQLLIPADLPADEVDAVQALAIEIFLAMRCDGMARVDFFYEDGGRGWLLNEVNTIPGFTPQSMYPKLWEASGVSYARLIDELVALALERHDRRAGFSTKR